MQYSELGRTGLSISRVGFGSGDRAGLMVGTDTAEQERVVGRALDAGITYFDTASKYGSGQSERTLGHALRVHGRDVVVGTKLELPPDAGVPFGETVRAHLHASLERLGTDHVHLYQLHDRIGVGPGAGWAPAGAKRLSVSEVLGPGGIGEVLTELKQEGLISAIGLTTFGGDPRAIAEIVESGVFDSLNCSFHMLNPTAFVPAGPGWPGADYNGVAALARERGMTVLAIRALGGGRILDSAPPSGPKDNARQPHPDLIWNDRVSRELDAALEGRGTSRAIAAMAWVQRWPQVSSVIAGISAPEHVDDAVTAGEDQVSWTDADVQAWCETLFEAAADPTSEEMSR